MSAKILVLDNDEDILVVINTILSIYKFECYTVNNWKIFKQKVEEIKPDLILLDIMLGGKDGRDLCRDLKDNIPTENIPVILFSSDPQRLNSYHDYRASDIIQKPFDVKEFLLKINRYLPGTTTV